MENNELTKQMLDKIDSLVRENENLKLALAAKDKQVEALETEVNTLRTAVHQMNLDHKEQAQPDPKKAEEELARDFAGSFKRVFGLDLTAEQVKAAIDCGDTNPAIELLRGLKSAQPQPTEYDRLRAQFPGVFEKYGPILGVAIIRKK
jgi:predicted RNase H-like nuclease (RuvC/YqgF family)